MSERVDSMDFHSLNRRFLQALCKMNKIPANMTNVAMANALQSLETVEGLEEFLKQQESQATESPAVTATLVPRSSNRQGSTNEGPDSSKPTIRTCRGSSRRFIIEETDQEKEDVTQTSTAAPKTRRGLSMCSLETPKTKGKGVEMPVYSSRRSARLLERKMRDLSLEEKEGLQRRFVESLQTTEEGDGFPETGGLPEVESKAISEVPQVGSCEKLDDLAKHQEKTACFQVDNSNLTLENAHNVSDADGAGDAHIVMGSNLLLRAESDSKELFTLLNETLKSNEESNLNVGNGQGVSSVVNHDDVGNANIEIDSSSEASLRVSKQLDAQNQAVAGKVDEGCVELKMSPAAISYDDPKEENKGVDDAQDGSIISIQINTVDVNKKDYELPQSLEGSVGDAYSDKLEVGGVDANPSKDEHDITLPACESQPCGAQKSDIVEADSCSERDSDTSDDSESKAYSVMNSKTADEIQLGGDDGEADCVSGASEHMSEDGNAKQPDLCADSLYVAPEKGVPATAIGGDARENYNACEEPESYKAIDGYSSADIAVSIGSVAVPSLEFDDQKGDSDQLVSDILNAADTYPVVKEEEVVPLGTCNGKVENGWFSFCAAEKQMIEACNPFRHKTPPKHTSSDNDSSSSGALAPEAIADLELEIEGLTLDPVTTSSPSKSPNKKSASAQRNTTHALENNKENNIANFPMPGAKVIDSTESGTPLEKRSLRRLKKEIRKLVEEKKQRHALQSVSDNCKTTEELAQGS